MPEYTMNSQTPTKLLSLGTFQHDLIHQTAGTWWFHEISKELFPGQSFGLEIKQILHHTTSEYQDILIFESTSFGNVLVLNGIVQCTEKDEFAYQELITHLPIMSHPSPKKVLVIGGGDCGVVRELVKHTTGIQEGTIESITMIEIDALVIQLAIKYLPEMAKFHNHPKVNLIIDDGFKFLKETKEVFDVIITDSSDPEGPAVEFFKESYFNLLLNALEPKNGIVIMQSSENIWLNIHYLKTLLDDCRTVFANVEYCQCYMPLYTSGQLGLLIASVNKKFDLKKPIRKFSSEVEEELFRYYSADVHNAAFVLPRWASKLLQ